MKPITCISSGPLVRSLNGGKYIIRNVPDDERQTPLVAAFLEDDEVAQMVVASPTVGVVRDYRKASLDAVYACETDLGTRFTRIEIPC